MSIFDWNKYAQLVTKWEGKKVQLSIAQVKEVIRILACTAAVEPEFCAHLSFYGQRVLIEKYAEHQIAKEKKCQTKKPKSRSKSRKPSKTKR